MAEANAGYTMSFSTADSFCQSQSFLYVQLNPCFLVRISQKWFVAYIVYVEEVKFVWKRTVLGIKAFPEN